MNLFESELEVLKSDFIRMWKLVSVQLKSSLQSLASLDAEKAREVIVAEKQVNELDLKIDKSCENIIALHNPVASDLRFVLALIKINLNLEKIGDIANRISKFVIKFGDPFYEELLNKTEALAMFEEVCELLDVTLNAFQNNDSKKARSIFVKDEYINEINRNAFVAIIGAIKDNPNDIEKYLKTLALLRRIEKAGDLTKNIAEEIIFYVEAKVVRHSTKTISSIDNNNPIAPNKLKVIIWLQNTDDEEIITKMFQDSNYELLNCKNADQLEALISKNNHSIRLLVIDSHIKDTNVLSLCQELKQNELLDAYIMVLEDIKGVSEVDALEHGADFFIHKPLKPGILIKRIDAILERKR